MKVHSWRTMHVHCATSLDMALRLIVVAATFYLGSANAQQTLELPRFQGQSLVNLHSPAALLATPTIQRPANVETVPRPAQSVATPSTEKSPVSQPTFAAQEVGRPSPLTAQPGCQLWRGTFSGNDPSVLVEARLCTDSQGEVTGVVQWSSLRSGYNVREVTGTSEPAGRVILHDTGFREYHPRFLWRFCLIDRYFLDHVGSNHLVGSYQSDTCNDHASVDLYLLVLR
jgi:hypothetical protein